MPSIVQSVRQTLARRALLAAGDRVAVALSGGSDSVALTLLLCELERRAPWRIAGLIHVNHGLRGAESDADEAFCREFALGVDLPIHVAHVDVTAHARERRCSVEVAARDLRYAALVEGAALLGASSVATGHTRDDQAETVLLRLLRGAATRGMSAIRPRRGIYVRPLIDCEHTALIDYLGRRSQPFRTDRSNTALDVPRNRLRHLVLPALIQEWPGAVRALARFAEIAADEDVFATALAAEMSDVIVRRGPHGVQLDARGLAACPPALARRVVRAAIESAGGTSSFRDVEAIRALARADKPNGHLDLGGLSVDRQGQVIQVWAPERVDGVSRIDRPDGLDRPMGTEAGDSPGDLVLAVPGSVIWPATGMTVLASMKVGVTDHECRDLPPAKAILQAAGVTLPLIVRRRRPGDRFRPLGAPGTRKLQDVFVDRKVPRAERDTVPVVADAAGRIVWVAGVAMAHGCRVTTPEEGVVILEMKGTQ